MKNNNYIDKTKITEIMLNYIELVEYHATIIYNNHCESSFAYFSENQTMIDLKNNFSKQVAEDIYNKVISMAMEDGVWRKFYY